MKERVLHLDYETRSAVNLKTAGVHAYAEDKSTDVWCAAYRFTDEKTKPWVPSGDWPDCPEDVEDHIRSGGIIKAWNANFERTISHHVLAKRYGWPEPKLEQWRCVMAAAMAMSLPASLENAAAAVGIEIRKDMAGHDLMMRMAKPRRRDDAGNLVWWDDQARLDRLVAYCCTDVDVEYEIDHRILPLRDFEQQLWFLDQRINDRGVFVDSLLCDQALKIVEQMQKRHNAEMARITDTEVTACSNTSQLMAWVRKRGIETDSIAKDEIADILVRADVPDDVRAALELRLEANKASVKKINSLLAGRSRDHRARGLLQYHAASTGRWAGRRFQPQNIKRPEIKDVDTAIEALLTGSARVVESLFDAPVLSIVGDCLRGMVRAPKGHQLDACDFSNIEGRGLAWLAGEEPKLEAFRKYDRGEGPDLYKVAAGKTFGVAPESIDKGDARRQVGKVQELAFGYQGGVNAFRKMARGNGVDMAKAADVVLANMREDLVEGATEMWGDQPAAVRREWVQDQWIAARCLVDAWRMAHPRIKQFWQDLEDAAVQAVDSDRVTRVGHLAFRKNGSFLFLRLPSGRCLCYPYPRVDEIETPWGAKKPTVVFKGVDTYTRKWGDRKTYGGLWSENVTQAVARDVLAEAMPRVEAAGYRIVLSVHDELVAETPSGFGSEAEFAKLMAEVPTWAQGFPIAVEGWRGARYRK